MIPEAVVAQTVEPDAQAASVIPSTLENLEANVAAELNTPTGTSAAPEGSTAPEGSAAAPGTEAEGPEAEVDGKLQRISQDNATLRATLRKVGIDPDSDVIDQINSGLLSVDDILRSRQPVAPQQPQTPTAPTLTLDQKITNLKTAVTKQDGDVSAEDFRSMMSQTFEVMNDQAEAIQAINQARDSDQRNIQAQTQVQAANAVFDTAIHLDVPDEVLPIARELFLGAVDNKVFELAANPNVGQEKALTPEGYTFAAQQLAPRFEALVNAIKGVPPTVGAPAAPAVPGQPAPVAPRTLAPGQGGAAPPPPTPKDKFSMANLKTNVAEYIAGTQAQVM